MLAIGQTDTYHSNITGNEFRASVTERRDSAPAKGRERAMSQSPNRLLDALPQNVFAAIDRHLQPLKFPFGEVFAETNRPISKVYFPYSGVVSLVVEMQVGDMIETAMVGRDGIVNGTS